MFLNVRRDNALEQVALPNIVLDFERDDYLKE